MKTRFGGYGLTALLLTSVVLTSFHSVEAKERKALTRSLYVPIAFRLCEHLTKATLYIGDQPVAMLPTERIFLFTYYPTLKRIEPAATELRIEGSRSDDGSPFIGRLAVNPEAIFTANQRVDLDFERAKKQLAYKIDSRYEKVNLRIRCDAQCGETDEPVATASFHTPAELPGADDKP